VLKLRYYPVVILLIAVFAPTSAMSQTPPQVSLAFVAPTGPNTGRVTVAPGATFDVRLNLSSNNATAGRTTGLDYYLTMIGAGSGLFTIEDRNITGSAYSDPYFTMPEMQAMPGTPLLLDPTNDADLGAVTATGVSNGSGTFLVAIFTIRVHPSTPFGEYSLRTISDPGFGWIGPSPDFPETDFSFHADYTIVVPEPTGLALLAGGAVALLRRRATSRVHRVA
jgi:hypothetical protein